MDLLIDGLRMAVEYGDEIDFNWTMEKMEDQDGGPFVLVRRMISGDCADVCTD